VIPLIRPDISFAEVADDIRGILDSGMLTRGMYVRAFEDAVRDFVGRRYAFATTSATTALHLSLVALGIGAGDEVLVSDFTFPASGNVIVEAGAQPVLVDCAQGRFDLDVEDLARKITPKTRAIMVVDPFGQSADMEAVSALAARHGLAVVEDAACALGASRNGRRCGTWPGAGCFSFHPRKVVTTGEGGMIVTDDAALADRIELLRSHGGRPVGGRFVFEACGFNYRLSEIPAALGLAQMRRVESIIADRRQTALCYLDALAGLDLSIPLSTSAQECSFQSFVVLLDDAIDRDAVVARMREDGIETTIGTYAMHAHPAFARFGYAPGDLPHSYRAECQALTLPLVPRMEPALVRHVVATLQQAMRHAPTRSRSAQ